MAHTLAAVAGAFRELDKTPPKFGRIQKTIWGRINEMHRFYAHPATLHDEHLILDAAETRHLRDVLRLTEGANVAVFDGQGNEYSCTVTEIKKNETELLILKQQDAASAESPLHLTLAAAMLKGEKYDLVVQKAVELGVTHLIPLRTARTDVKSKDSVKRVLRWRKIVLEASKQCGRALLMNVADPVDYEVFLSMADAKQTIMFSERDGEALPNKMPDKKITAVVGPEGGWDDVELAAARSADIHVVTFGGRTLKAETAAIAFTAILENRFGDIR
jgi:16S rRNA (uracil1498-N3)-methyltransferase